jgi:hypothetical protein
MIIIILTCFGNRVPSSREWWIYVALCFMVCILCTLLSAFFGHCTEYMKMQGLSDINYIRDISDTPADCKYSTKIHVRRHADERQDYWWLVRNWLS